MPDLRDLTFAATQAITLFNALQYDTLEQMLESDVSIKKVLHPGSVTGIGEVSAYLDKHMKTRNPRLNADNAGNPWNGPLALAPADPSQATNATASGRGYYVDTDTSHPPITTVTPISFTLTFVRDNKNQDWSLAAATTTLIPPF
jgi:hypothetical protein